MATTAFLQKAYLAYFGRPVDFTGTTAFANSTELQVQNAFSASAESQALYGSTFGAAQINAIYQVLFGRSAEPAGLAYWSNQVQLGLLTPAGAAVGILNGALNADSIAVANKLDASAKFTIGLDTTAKILGYSGNVAASSGVDFLKSVTATPVTQAQVDAGVGVAVAAGTTTINVGTTFTLTTGVDALVGGAGNDTFLGVIDNFGTASAATAGVRTTISLGDSIDGGAGVNTFNIATNLTGPTTIPGVVGKNIQIVNVNNSSVNVADVATIAAGNFAQATQFNATGSSSLTVTGIGSAAIGVLGIVAPSTGGGIQAINAVGANTVNIQGTSISAAAAAAGAAINIDVSGGSATAAQAVVINSTGTTANNVTNVKIGNGTVGASALTVNAAANLKTTITEFVANTLKTVVISGAAATVDLGTIPSAGLTSVDASGLTVGGAKVTIGTNVATTFKGGVGNDTLTISAGVAMTGASDGGTGTNTLSISDALAATGTDTSLTAATAVKFTNFQTLQVASSSGAGVDTTFDASLLAGVTSFNIGASAGGVIVSNLAANATVNLVGTAAGTSGTAFSFKAPSVTNTDTLNFNINNASTATTGNVSGLTDAKLSVGASVSTLNIGSGGTILGSGTQNTITGLNAGDTGITKIVITGAAPLSLTTGVLTKSLTIDGSAATGGLTIDASGITSTTVSTSINGGTANDTISANTKFIGTQTIYGGAGGDTITLGTHTAAVIDSLVYKAGTDSLLDATGTTGASGTGTANTGKMDAVTTFQSGSDKIDITAFNTITAQKGVADKGTFTSLTAAITAATANTTFFNDASNTQRVATEFHIAIAAVGTFGQAGFVAASTDTYVVVDVNHNGVFDVALDLGIKLTGTASVVAADFLA